LASLAIEARPAVSGNITSEISSGDTSRILEILLAHSSSQNHYRDHDAADDQAKRYGGRDNFKFVPVLCEMQAWEQQFSKIIFQHKSL
jgi:hypothetical protein